MPNEMNVIPNKRSSEMNQRDNITRQNLVNVSGKNVENTGKLNLWLFILSGY